MQLSSRHAAHASAPARRLTSPAGMELSKTTAVMKRSDGMHVATAGRTRVVTVGRTRLVTVGRTRVGIVGGTRVVTADRTRVVTMGRTYVVTVGGTRDIIRRLWV